jgi:hypothetical protein
VAREKSKQLKNNPKGIDPPKLVKGTIPTIQEIYKCSSIEGKCCTLHIFDS